ncbi:hypothetical protein TWF481_006727 [Arthrobotrys musiformis]|uniref:Kinesin light chain n=1 Tax=Arthrobotrys musiformis TaxID=47236 RepID=A0AAV9W9D4_9PEZI
MTGRLEEAEENLRMAANHFAEFHVDQEGLMRDERKRLYIRILKDIGEVLLQKGSTDAAIELLRHILDSQTETLGESHPTILTTKLNLGRAYTAKSQFTLAQGLLGQVITTYTEWWGQNNIDTMRAVDELAFILMKEGEQKQSDGISASWEFQSAEGLWDQMVLGFYTNLYGDSSDMACQVRSNIQYLRSIMRI